ncbi:MAG TPA: thioester reductase, partial [Erysipelotrichaceae bacterium]|nr:thioester reductase [Erysipelotrichaceae bacterium]
RAGIGPEDFVAMFTPRSLEMIIGIYGILKAGAAYVPIDPAYPEQRIRYMLDDCRPKAILTYGVGEEIKKLFKDVLVIDLAEKSIYEGTVKKQKVKVAEDQLAYCIYTSG